MLRNLRYIYFLMLSLLLFGCEKNNDFEYVNPSIRMVEVYLKEDNLCTLTLEIETGVGFSGHSAWIELYDITAGSSQPVKKPITLTEDAKQTHTLEFGAPVENHDFLVKGVLTTSKNRFETWGKYIYFSKKSHKYDFSNPYVYGDVAMLYGDCLVFPPILYSTEKPLQLPEHPIFPGQYIVVQNNLQMLYLPANMPLYGLRLNKNDQVQYIQGTMYR